MSIKKTDRTTPTDSTIHPQQARGAARDSVGPSRSRGQDIPERSDKHALFKEILDCLVVCTLCKIHPINDIEIEMMDQETQTDVRYDDVKIETIDQETQTDVCYDEIIDKMTVDNDAQTELTCKPRLSNSKLLVQYEELKNFIRSNLEQCFVQGVEPRIVIDDLLDEIVAKGANIIKYPTRDQLIQTIASYKTHVKRDEDILKKLRIPVVVDPSELLIIVAPLMDDLLNLTCDMVSRNARYVVKDILGTLIRRIVAIEYKLEAIKRQQQRPTTEQLFLQRKKKIAESMKKHTETVATQTGLAGVPEIARLKPKDILCSVCARESICDMCLVTQGESPPLPKEDTKILRTQDILLAYNPCYVVTTPSEKKKNPYLQLSSAMEKKIENPTVAQLPMSQYVTKPKETRVVRDKEAINVLMTPKKRTQAQDSVSGWARVIDNTWAKSWCLEDSASNATNASITSSATRSTSKTMSCCKKNSQFESVLSSQATKAFRVLKDAFCTRDTCPDALLVRSTKNQLIKDEIKRSNLSCDVESYALLNLDRHHGRPINNVNGQICARPRADKFRAAPTRPSSES